MIKEKGIFPRRHFRLTWGRTWRSHRAHPRPFHPPSTEPRPGSLHLSVCHLPPIIMVLNSIHHGSALNNMNSYHLWSWKNFAVTIFLICTVKLFINDFDLTVINNFVHQNLCLEFPQSSWFSWAVVIFLRKSLQRIRS
jgi:hypothetical protein